MKLDQSGQLQRSPAGPIPLSRTGPNAGGRSVLTLIPYTSYLAVLAFQATSGPVLGALCGGLLGLARELPALIVAVGTKPTFSPKGLMALLPKWYSSGRRINFAITVALFAALGVLTLEPSAGTYW